ncbi:hypothetical protein JOL79_11455 [Microbispora sp. RL4-1S]|uniref:Uncharacterized protein n=1 Tax=Microbispora oryzae TaxID=2806554 RepID=A0A940WN13_9ACTN|nr:hypothetical protein [Microbispora oryzae]MBP2704430.1 hypothetical protein [Microbispora oryzae]
MTVVPCQGTDDVLLLPALWPVRLSPAARRELAAALLALDEETADGP